MNIIIMIILFIEAVRDFKTRKIALYSALAIAVCGIIENILIKPENYKQIIAGGTVGLVFIISGFLFKNSFGMGDGFIIASLGLFYGTKIINIVLIASLLMACVSLFLLILKKAEKKTKIPFVPCIFIGALTGVIL